MLVENLRDALEDLASREFQERVWRDGQGPEVSSLDELRCQVFDDTGLSDVLEDGRLDAQVGAGAAAALRELRAALASVDSSLSPADLVAHPGMESVRACARRARELLA